jgi:hypothetical protein
MLSCSREHLMRMARRGEVAGAKVGREWVFTQEALSELVARRTVVRIQPTKRGRRRNEVPRL